MKFLHMSDLHLGIRLYEQSFLDDQRYMLSKALDVIDSENIDCVFIVGDIYDKQVPPAEAVALFDRFISSLSKLNVQVFISSGNHDSGERLSFGSSVMSEQGMHFSPVYDGSISPVTLTDEHGDVDIYMIPFIKPANVRRFFEDTDINTYTDALKSVVSSLAIDTNKRNVLLCHQNVGTAEQCESTVGGLDMVDISVFELFDYVALGHIHQSYPIERDSVRYCGTVLNYDFRFCNSERGFTVIDMDSNGQIAHRLIPFEPMHTMMKIRGKLADLISPDKIDSRAVDSYLQVTLTDEQEIIDSVGKLRAYYPRLLSVEYDNTRTRTQQFVNLGGDTAEKTPYELFFEFYELQNNDSMNEEQTEIVKKIIEDVWGEDE